MAWLSLFKNERKQDGDNLPLYSNSKMSFDETIILEKGKFYEMALWKKTQTKDGNPTDQVSIKISESDYWNSKAEVMAEPINETEQTQPKSRDDIPF